MLGCLGGWGLGSLRNFDWRRWKGEDGGRQRGWGSWAVYDHGDGLYFMGKMYSFVSARSAIHKRTFFAL